MAIIAVAAFLNSKKRQASLTQSEVTKLTSPFTCAKSRVAFSKSPDSTQWKCGERYKEQVVRIF